MDERLHDLLGRLGDLNDDELTELRALLDEGYDAVNAAVAEQGDTTETNEAYEQLADAYDTLAGEETRREEARAELAAQAEERRARIDAARGTPPAETVAEHDDDTNAEHADGENVEGDGEQDGQEPVVETPEVIEETPEPVAASAVPADLPARRPVNLGLVQQFRSRHHQAPAPTTDESSDVMIRAAAGVPNVAAGASLAWDDIGPALGEVWESMRRARGGADGEEVRVATVETAAARAPRKVSSAGETSAELLVPVLAAARQFGVDVRNPEPIIAAGGLCGPPEVIYDWPTIGNARTPIADALARTPAARGQVMYPTPYFWADVEGVTNGVVNDWTLQNDIDAATGSSPRKQCTTVICPTWITDHVNAYYSCITFGNFAARFNPLVNENFMREVPKVVARHMEAAKIAAIEAASVAGGGLGGTGRAFHYTTVLGTGRDLKAALSILTTAYRQRYRMNDTDPLVLLTNDWVIRAVQEDMLRQIPGDDEFDAELAEYRREIYANANVNVVESPDIDRFSIGTEGASGGSGTIAGFPTSATFYLFPPDTFTVLDGGTLDIGVVRDSALIAANNFQMFTEWWEHVIQTGFASWKVTLDVAARGNTAATVANGSPAY